MRRIICAMALTLFLTFLFGCRASEGIEWVKTPTPKDAAQNVDASIQREPDLSRLRCNDGQPLIGAFLTKDYPVRPKDPLALPKTDPLHWYDSEYIGHNWTRLNKRNPVQDTANGKSIIMISTDSHPYWTSLGIGAKKVADAYGMKFKMYCANRSVDLQNELIDRAIKEAPDMMLVAPIDKDESEKQFKRIHDAGIPIIAFNMIPTSSALQYILAWSGPDDWAQQRMLARALADKLGKKGGVCFLTHVIGGSPYYSRLYGPISELAAYAPAMNVLDYASPNYDVEMCRQIVLGWISKYGNSLNAIYCADDYFQTTGVARALKESARTDIVLVAAGHSKNGLDQVKAGEVYMITYQPCESDGALAVELAADWFNGKEIPPVSYIRTGLIDQSNVDNYMPSQG